LKALVVSDIHYNHRFITWFKAECTNYDLVLLGGDIVMWADREFFTSFYESLANSKCPIYYVRGNQDPPDTMVNQDSVICVEGRVVTHQGLRIAGLGGSNPTPFNTPYELSDEEAEERLKALTSPIDILISHTPPYGTRCDRPANREHAGSLPVRRFVERVRPRLVVCGHIHESRAIDYVGPTLILNPGAAVNNNYAVVELAPQPSAQLLKAPP
jgi:hypothetical protein